MRALYILLILILLAAPLYAADQALVLTEIEQIQEKIWYLQRDLAAQKDALEKQKGQLAVMAAQAKEQQAGFSDQLATLTQTVKSQAELAARSESQLTQLQGTLLEFQEKINQKEETNLDVASKVSSLEGSLQALRSELAAQQKSHDQALAELRKQQEETRSQLDTMTQKGKGLNDQVILWGAVAALTIAVLFTLVFALKGRKGKSHYDERRDSSHHEL